MKEKIPDKLSKEARDFYKKILQEYQIEDVAGLKLLLSGCECLRISWIPSIFSIFGSTATLKPFISGLKVR